MMFLSILTAPLQKNRNLLLDEQEVHKELLNAFGCKRDSANILYRKDISRDGSSIVLMVQSDIAPSETKTFSIERLMNADARNESFTNGTVLRFDCKLQPTFNKDGRRRALRKYEEREAWLRRKLSNAGAEVIGFTESGKNTTVFTHNDVGKIETYIYTGYLRITDAERFLEGYRNGIGAGKAYGCGMLILGRA